MGSNSDARTPAESLVGKVAVVTGAASGIGAATAAELSERGMAVLVADINGEAANGQAEAINASGGRALGAQVDVAEEADIQRMITLAVDSFGHLDLLHNNAAATQDSVNDEDILTMDVAIWDRTMAVNLRGAMLGCKHAIPYMLQTGGGVIVNTSSGAGTLAEPVRVAYWRVESGHEFPHTIGRRPVRKEKHPLCLHCAGHHHGAGDTGSHPPLRGGYK